MFVFSWKQSGLSTEVLLKKSNIYEYFLYSELELIIFEIQ